MTTETLKEYILTLQDVWIDTSLEEGVIAFRVGDAQSGRLFALIHGEASPLRVSLRCDPNLALVLRDQYETVLPGQNLNKKDWNTVICSGQLADEEIFDLVRHAHQLVGEEK